jgi:hypothetical protein
MLDKYEALNLTTYVDGEATKMVFGNKQSSESEETIE